MNVIIYCSLCAYGSHGYRLLSRRCEYVGQDRNGKELAVFVEKNRLNMLMSALESVDNGSCVASHLAISHDELSSSLS